MCQLNTSLPKSSSSVEANCRQGENRESRVESPVSSCDEEAAPTACTVRHGARPVVHHTRLRAWCSLLTAKAQLCIDFDHFMLVHIELSSIEYREPNQEDYTKKVECRASSVRSSVERRVATPPYQESRIESVESSDECRVSSFEFLVRVAFAESQFLFRVFHSRQWRSLLSLRQRQRQDAEAGSSESSVVYASAFASVDAPKSTM